MKIELIVTIITVIILVGGTVGIISVGAQIVVGINDMGINQTETICDELGLEVLSVSRQVFGDDYVVCYDQDTNKTRRIEI